MASIIQNVVDMAGYIGDAAFSFPTSIILVVVGSLLIAGASVALGLLAAGAVVDFLTPESLGRKPPQRG